MKHVSCPKNALKTLSCLITKRRMQNKSVIQELIKISPPIMIQNLSSLNCKGFDVVYIVTQLVFLSIRYLKLLSTFLKEYMWTKMDFKKFKIYAKIEKQELFYCQCLNLTLTHLFCSTSTIFIILNLDSHLDASKIRQIFALLTHCTEVLVTYS